MTADVTRDTIHRTAKLLFESGKARTLEEARTYLESMVLQVAVGPDIGSDLAAQAALLTAVNAGGRAFLGGVHVVLDGDPILDVPWAADLTARAAVQRFGGVVVDGLDPGPADARHRHSRGAAWAATCSTSPTTVGSEESCRVPTPWWRWWDRAGRDRGRSARHLRGVPEGAGRPRARPS